MSEYKVMECVDENSVSHTIRSDPPRMYPCQVLHYCRFFLGCLSTLPLHAILFIVLTCCRVCVCCIESLTQGMDRSVQCGYCCFNQVVHEYGRFLFDGREVRPNNVQTRFYPLYEILSVHNLDENQYYIEG